jgi:hypothetical protein
MRFRVEDVVAFKDVLAAAPPERRGRPAGTTDIARIAREIVDTAGTPDVLWPSSGLTLQGFEVATDAG